MATCGKHQAPHKKPLCVRERQYEEIRFIRKGQNVSETKPADMHHRITLYVRYADHYNDWNDIMRNK